MALLIEPFSVWKVIGTTGSCGDVLILVLLTARRLYRKFPLFYLFIACAVAQDVVQDTFLFRSPTWDESSTYGILTIYTNIAPMVLGLLAIPEAMREVAGRKPAAFHRASAALFALFTAFIVAPLTIFLAQRSVLLSGGLPGWTVIEGLNALWFACMVMRLGLVLVFVSVAWFLRLRWTRYAACLLIGFGLLDAWLIGFASNQWVDFAPINDPTIITLREWAEVVVSPAMYFLTLAPWIWGVWRESGSAALPVDASRLDSATEQLADLKVAVAALQSASNTVNGDPQAEDLH